VVAGGTIWIRRGDSAGGLVIFKEVNPDETTVRFWQEIYDDTGKLVEIHEKFPLDKGHKKV
jgi:hypothetical protein